jgi:hypothetical protein
VLINMYRSRMEGNRSSLCAHASSAAGAADLTPIRSFFHATKSSISVGHAWCQMFSTNNSEMIGKGISPHPPHNCQGLD